MEHGEILSLEQIRTFLEASEKVRFQANDRGSCTSGSTRACASRITASSNARARDWYGATWPRLPGLSRAQTRRLIGIYQQGREVKPRVYRRRHFPNRYRPKDIELLAQMDEAHETLSDPATQNILERELDEFHDARYDRLARLSVAQLYRLRKCRTHRSKRVAFQLTRPTQWRSGNGASPDPQNRPGYLRVDTIPCIKSFLGPGASTVIEYVAGSICAKVYYTVPTTGASSSGASTGCSSSWRQ